jgi:hypothetical protein
MRTFKILTLIYASYGFFVRINIWKIRGMGVMAILVGLGMEGTEDMDWSSIWNISKEISMK